MGGRLPMCVRRRSVTVQPLKPLMIMGLVLIEVALWQWRVV